MTHMNGTGDGDWICTTCVTLTRFSVPLIPNTHDHPFRTLPRPRPGRPKTSLLLFAASCLRSSPAPEALPCLPRKNFSSAASATSIPGTAYFIAVKRFLAWAEKRGLELMRIAPKDVGQYLDGSGKAKYERRHPQAAPRRAPAFFRWHGHPARDPSESRALGAR